MSEALAKTSPEPRAHGAEASLYLTFSAGGELFALPIEHILEVIEFHGLTRIPLASAVVPGVLNLRGAVIPVVDLAVRFGRAPTVVGRRTCAVVVEVEMDDGVLPVGVMVDSVSEAREAQPGQLERRPAFGSGIRGDFVAGMLDVAGSFVTVLELRAVLSLGELEQLAV